MVGVHVSQLDIDEKHDLWGRPGQRASGKDTTEFKNAWAAGRKTLGHIRKVRVLNKQIATVTPISERQKEHEAKQLKNMEWGTQGRNPCKQ